MRRARARACRKLQFYRVMIFTLHIRCHFIDSARCAEVRRVGWRFLDSININRRLTRRFVCKLFIVSYQHHLHMLFMGDIFHLWEFSIVTAPSKLQISIIAKPSVESIQLPFLFCCTAKTICDGNKYNSIHFRYFLRISLENCWSGRERRLKT